MVIYDLVCASGHRFEGWFQNLEACTDQAARGLIACPVCGSTDVQKRVTGSAIRRSAEDRAGMQLPATTLEPPKPPDTAPPPPPTPTQIREFLGNLAAAVRAGSEDVGSRFAEEARRIHRGEAPERMIRGSATEAEEAVLVDEEVPFMKLPLPGTDD